MSQAKPFSTSKRKNKIVPVLGAAGLSLSLAGGASAATEKLNAHAPTLGNETSHEIILGEEEVFDVSLATFLVVDKENGGTFKPGRRLAMGGGGGCGCGCACACASAGCAAATGNNGAWTSESDAHVPLRSIKPAHPGRRVHTPKSP